MAGTNVAHPRDMEPVGAPSSPTVPAPAIPVMQRAFAELASSIYTGVAVGLVTIGIGLRLAMRVSMLAGGNGVRGRLTENGNVIGEVTADGTGFLILAGAALGGLLGVGHLVVRRWLPTAGRYEGLVFGAVVLLVGRGLFVDDANRDFAELEPRLLNVVMFALLPLLFGAVFVPTRAWVATRFPLPRWRSPALLLYLPLPVLTLGPAFGLPILIVVAVAAWTIGNRPSWFSWWHRRVVTSVGRVALVAAVAVGSVEFVRRVSAIL